MNEAFNVTGICDPPQIPKSITGLYAHTAVTFSPARQSTVLVTLHLVCSTETHHLDYQAINTRSLKDSKADIVES